MITSKLAVLREKTEIHDELLQLFSQKTHEVSDADEKIKTEINDIRERLETIQVLKMRERKLGKKQREKTKLQKRELETSIDNLKKDLVDLDNYVKKILQEAEDAHSATTKTFDETIRPLEEAKDAVLTHKNAVIGRKEEAAQLKQESIETITMMKEDQYQRSEIQIPEL